MKISIVFASILWMPLFGYPLNTDINVAGERENHKAILWQNPLTDPCVLSAKEIAEIIGWEDYSDPQSNPMNSKTMKSCMYPTNLSGALTITYRQYKIRNPNGRYLERAFNRDLENTDKKMIHETITDLAGDQMIYSYGSVGPNKLYKLRWRFGNHTEKSVDYRAPKEQDVTTTLEKLKTIVKALEKS